MWRFWPDVQRCCKCRCCWWKPRAGIQRECWNLSVCSSLPFIICLRLAGRDGKNRWWSISGCILCRRSRLNNWTEGHSPVSHPGLDSVRLWRRHQWPCQKKSCRSRQRRWSKFWLRPPLDPRSPGHPLRGSVWRPWCGAGWCLAILR